MISCRSEARFIYVIFLRSMYTEGAGGISYEYQAGYVSPNTYYN